MKNHGPSPMTTPEWQIPAPRSLARCCSCGLFVVNLDEWKQGGHWLNGAEALKLAQGREPLELEERR